MASAGQIGRVRIRIKLIRVASLSGCRVVVNGETLDLGELGANPSFHGHYVPPKMGRNLKGCSRYRFFCPYLAVEIPKFYLAIGRKSDLLQRI